MHTISNDSSHLLLFIPAANLNACSVRNGGCSHICIPRPNGRKCACPDGMKRGTRSNTCQDTRVSSKPYLPGHVAMTTTHVPSVTSLPEVIHRREPPVDYYTPDVVDDLQLSGTDPTPRQNPVVYLNGSTVINATDTPVIFETHNMSTQYSKPNTPWLSKSDNTTASVKEQPQTPIPERMITIPVLLSTPVPWWKTPRTDQNKAHKTSIEGATTTRSITLGTRTTYTVQPIIANTTMSPTSDNVTYKIQPITPHITASRDDGNTNMSFNSHSPDLNIVSKDETNTSLISDIAVPNVPHIRTAGHPKRPKFPLFNPDVPHISPTRNNAMEAGKNVSDVSLSGE